MFQLMQKLVVAGSTSRTIYCASKSTSAIIQSQSTPWSSRMLLAKNSRHFLSTTTASTDDGPAKEKDTTKPKQKYLRVLRIRLMNKFLGFRQQQKMAGHQGAGGGGHHGLKLSYYLRRKSEAEDAEQVPSGLFKKLKYYLKRYWYIALPVHTVICGIWLGGLYLAVQSGLDVVALLESLHLPESWVDKVRQLPKAAGSLAAALVLYKVVTPLRYATSLLGIQMAFKWLRRVGLLRTARQLQLKGLERTEAFRRRLAERRRLAKMVNDERKRKGGGSSGGQHKNGGGSPEKTAPPAKNG